MKVGKLSNKSNLSDQRMEIRQDGFSLTNVHVKILKFFEQNDLFIFFLFRFLLKTFLDKDASLVWTSFKVCTR